VFLWHFNFSLISVCLDILKGQLLGNILVLTNCNIYYSCPIYDWRSYTLVDSLVHRCTVTGVNMVSINWDERKGAAIRGGWRPSGHR